MIQRVFALFLLLQLQLFAAHYNSTIIELEAKLFPKILMLSEDINKSSSFLDIVIVSQEKDMLFAEEFLKAILRNFSEKLMGRDLRVVINTAKTLQKNSTNPDGIIVLYHSNDTLISLAQWANKRRVVSFAYDAAHLEFGLLGSIDIGVATKPYLNEKIIKEYDFNFNPYLLELSKFK